MASVIGSHWTAGDWSLKHVFVSSVPSKPIFLAGRRIGLYDLAQARAWPRVLCLNHGQVAFGAPGEALSTDVLRRTYGDELVILDGSGQAVTVAHHSHEH